MDIIGTLLVFTVLLKSAMSGTGLHCYECKASAKELIKDEIEPRSKLARRLCEVFDASAPFRQDCDNSSMCYKKIIQSPYAETLYERGCAKQTYEGYQELKDHRWYPVLKINEVYQEGCIENPGDVDRVTKTTHCYCRGSYCNGTSRVGLTVSIVASLLLLCYL